jgi:DNA-binding HxlR family transcriptional regulator
MASTPPTHTDCIAVAVAILGDKWTPLLVRGLSEQAQRFCQLQDAMGGVNPRTLSARLARLEHCGIITKTTYNEVPPHTEYALTAKGRDLLPILASMAAWGQKYQPAS